MNLLKLIFFNLFLQYFGNKKYHCHLNEVTMKLLNALLFSGAFIKTFATYVQLEKTSGKFND